MDSRAVNLDLVPEHHTKHIVQLYVLEQYAVFSAIVLISMKKESSVKLTFFFHVSPFLFCSSPSLLLFVPNPLFHTIPSNSLCPLLADAMTFFEAALRDLLLLRAMHH